jgi:hypothetical protein
MTPQLAYTKRYCICSDHFLSSDYNNAEPQTSKRYLRSSDIIPSLHGPNIHDSSGHLISPFPLPRISADAEIQARFIGLLSSEDHINCLHMNDEDDNEHCNWQFKDYAEILAGSDCESLDDHDKVGSQNKNVMGTDGMGELKANFLQGFGTEYKLIGY